MSKRIIEITEKPVNFYGRTIKDGDTELSYGDLILFLFRIVPQQGYNITEQNTIFILGSLIGMAMKDGEKKLTLSTEQYDLLKKVVDENKNVNVREEDKSALGIESIGALRKMVNDAEVIKEK